MRGARVLLVGVLLAAVTALAADGYATYLRDLAWRESKHQLDAKNGSHIGLFQMGTAALIDSGYLTRDGRWTGKNGATSREAFLSSPAIQTQAIHDYNQVQWAWIQRNGLDRYVGQSVGGVQVTESGLLAGAHLVGRAGLACYLAGRFCDTPGVTLRNGVPVDGLGTTVSEYLAKFGGHDLDLSAGAPPTVNYSSGYRPTYGSLAGSGGNADGTDTGIDQDIGVQAPTPPIRFGDGYRGGPAEVTIDGAGASVLRDLFFGVLIAIGLTIAARSVQAEHQSAGEGRSSYGRVLMLAGRWWLVLLVVGGVVYW